jgi:hypothetical protein
VTVGAHPDLRYCEAVARELTAARRVMTGVLDAVDVLEVNPGAIATRARLGLVGTLVRTK